MQCFSVVTNAMFVARSQVPAQFRENERNQYSKVHIKLMSKSKDVVEETETAINEMQSFLQREFFSTKL